MCSVTTEEGVPVYPDARELSEECFLTQTWAAVQGGFIFSLWNCCSFSALVSVFVESVTKQTFAIKVYLSNSSNVNASPVLSCIYSFSNGLFSDICVSEKPGMIIPLCN